MPPKAKVPKPLPHPAATADFWRERWQLKQIGFHEGKPNEHLCKHWPNLGVRRGARVLVPLCGASEDLGWLLAHGHEVIGIELANEAVQRYFDQHELPFEREVMGKVTAWRAGPLTILEGNLFDVKLAHVGRCDALYDRAALIALPPPLRLKYVAHMRRWFAPDAVGLLVSMTYDAAKRGGPPFVVPDSEVLQHWPDAVQLHHAPIEEERWQGFDAFESVWALKP